MGFYNEERGLIGIEDTDLDMTWNIYKSENKLNTKRIIINLPMVIYLSHSGQATSDSNLLKKKQMMQILADKYSNNSLINLSHIYGQLGNLKILLDDLSGRADIRESLRIKFNLLALTYLYLSYLGTTIYKLLIPALKIIRDNIFCRIKVLKMSMKYRRYFLEAVKVSSGYKDWL
jgi:hypothetical protein